MDQETLRRLDEIEAKLDRILKIVENPLPGIDVSTIMTQAIEMTRATMPSAHQITSQARGR